LDTRSTPRSYPKIGYPINSKKPPPKLDTRSTPRTTQNWILDQLQEATPKIGYSVNSKNHPKTGYPLNSFRNKREKTAFLGVSVTLVLQKYIDPFLEGLFPTSDSINSNNNQRNKNINLQNIICQSSTSNRMTT